MLSPLRKTRILKELSLYDIKAKTGIDVGKLSLVERGYVSPSRDEMRRLARALGCRVEEIFPPHPEAQQNA